MEISFRVTEGVYRQICAVMETLIVVIYPMKRIVQQVILFLSNKFFAIYLQEFKLLGRKNFVLCLFVKRKITRIIFTS